MGNTRDIILPGSRGRGAGTGMGRALLKKLLTSCFIHIIAQEDKWKKLLPCPHCSWLSRTTVICLSSFSHPPPKEIKIVTPPFTKDFTTCPDQEAGCNQAPLVLFSHLSCPQREEQRDRELLVLTCNKLAQLCSR